MPFTYVNLQDKEVSSLFVFVLFFGWFLFSRQRFKLQFLSESIDMTALKKDVRNFYGYNPRNKKKTILELQS